MDLKDLCDNQAEAGIIATLIYHSDFILHSDYLKPKYFYNLDNASIYWAIKELYNNKIVNIDAYNLSNMLNSNKAVKNAIEQYNLPSIQEYMDLCINVKRDTLAEYLFLVDRVVELAFKRDFYKTTTDFQNMCFDKSITLSQLSNKTYKSLSDLTGKYLTTGDIKPIGAKVDELYEKMLSRRNTNGSYGIPSKFPTIGNYFSYEATELVVVKARMKKGKSILAMNEGVHKAMSGVTTLIYDSEMSDDNFYIRLLAFLSGVRVIDIKNGRYDEYGERRINEANETIKKLPLIHVYDPYMTNEKLYSICAEKQIELGLQFVIYDYIKGSGNILDAASRSADMAAKTDFLKNELAGNLNLSVLAFCQLNRLNKVAESDGIEKNCSVSVTWREKTEEEIIKDGADCGNYILSVDLNRLGGQMDGSEDYLDMFFDGDKLLITEAKPHVKGKNPF